MSLYGHYLVLLHNQKRGFMPRLEIRISAWLKHQAKMRCDGNLSKYIKGLIRLDLPRPTPIKKINSIRRNTDNR